MHKCCSCCRFVDRWRCQEFWQFKSLHKTSSASGGRRMFTGKHDVAIRDDYFMIGDGQVQLGDPGDGAAKHPRTRLHRPPWRTGIPQQECHRAKTLYKLLYCNWYPPARKILILLNLKNARPGLRWAGTITAGLWALLAVGPMTPPWGIEALLRPTFSWHFSLLKGQCVTSCLARWSSTLSMLERRSLVAAQHLNTLFATIKLNIDLKFNIYLQP